MVQPSLVISEEVKPEYKLFFDDLEKEYTVNSDSDLRTILIITKDRQGYRRLKDSNGNLLETEIKKRFSELLNTHYKKYRTAMLNSQYLTEKKELEQLIRDIDTRSDTRYFYRMHSIAQDTIYYSISKLNPEMHKINLFFIEFFNNRDGIRFEHENIFDFTNTLRSPDFRGSIMAYVSNNLDAVERSPFFTMFMVPKNLTQFGEEHLSEIITEFAELMQEYENRNGITIARDCYKKPHVMNERKLEKIIHDLTRKAEDEVRNRHGLPKVGEGWLQETILFRKLQLAFPNTEVIHQGKPKWLGNQRLDIWMPKKKAAVEYNGRQHYEAIDYFGGDEAFAMQQELDQRKAALCADNNVRLFIVRYDEDMDVAVSMIKGII